MRYWPTETKRISTHYQIEVIIALFDSNHNKDRQFKKFDLLDLQTVILIMVLSAMTRAQGMFNRKYMFKF